MDFLTTPAHWIWLIISLTLFAAELIAPLTYFLWLGCAGLLTALVVWWLPSLMWQLQSVLFSVLAVTSIILSRKWSIHRPSDSPALNRRAEQYIGRVYPLSEAIEHGYGKVRVDDSHWRVHGPTLACGHLVRVVSVDGAVFVVEAANTE